MAGSLNKVILIGNLGADPEIRTFGNGGKVCNIRLATSERWKDKNTGEPCERTEWHTLAIFSEWLVRVCESYLRKGSKIYIEGQLQTRKWQDKEDAKLVASLKAGTSIDDMSKAHSRSPSAIMSRLHKNDLIEIQVK